MAQSNGKKLIALTFDDGPDAEKTPRVLERLEKYKVKATFMMIGQLVNSNTAPVIKRIQKDKCEIGNHSWAWESLDQKPVEEIKKSINDTSAAIKKYAKTTPRFFRPPNLATSDTLLETVDMPCVCGVIAYDWDGCGTDAQKRADNVINGVTDGSIILMHDVQPDPHPTPEALDILIPALLNQGYEFVTLSEMFKRKGVSLESAKGKMWTVVE